MTNEQLTAEVKALEHFLVDVWDWHELWKLGRDLHAIDGWRMQSARPNDYTAWWREGDTKLTQHLVGCHETAVREIETVTSRLGSTPIPDLLLTKLRDDLLLLTDPEQLFRQWLEIAEVPESVQMDETGAEFGPRALYYASSQELWSYVTRDLSFYIGKVAAYIDLFRTGIADRTTPEPASPSARLRTHWIGSASELAFLLTDLVEAGYLVPPPIGKKTGKDGNRAAIADAVLNAFDIRKDNGDGDPVSPAYFRSLMRPDSPDRGTFTKLFTIRPRTASK